MVAAISAPRRTFRKPPCPSAKGDRLSDGRGFPTARRAAAPATSTMPCRMKRRRPAERSEKAGSLRSCLVGERAEVIALVTEQAKSPSRFSAPWSPGKVGIRCWMAEPCPPAIFAFPESRAGGTAALANEPPGGRSGDWFSTDISRDYRFRKQRMPSDADAHSCGFKPENGRCVARKIIDDLGKVFI